jgi:hypothetical protein
MESELKMKTADVETKNINDSLSEIGGASSDVIYVDPEKEASARRKFDKYLVPVSLLFIILSALDRNNVSLIFFMQIS